MQFLQPNYLWALGALAIPIAIHLFNFQRRRKVYFSNVALLEQVEQSTSAMRKLKHYLALVLRMLAITALVLAFSQPVLNNDSANITGEGDISIWIDNSPSSVADNGNGTVLDRSVPVAEKLIGQYSTLTRFQILDNGFTGADGWFYGKKQSLKRLRSLEQGFQVRTGAEVLSRQNASLARESGVRKEVWWIGDFQKNLQLEAGALPIEKGVTYHWVPIETGKPANISIDSAWLDNPVLQAGSTQMLKVKISNRSNTPANEVQVRFLIEDKLAGSTSSGLEPGQTKVVSFNFSLPESKPYQSRIEITDQPIVFDNVRYLVFQPLPKVKVVWVSDANYSAVDALFGNKELFELTKMSSSNLNPSKFSDADLLVLGVSGKTDITGFSGFKDNGTALVLYPEAISGEAYEKVIKSLAKIQANAIGGRDTAVLSSAIEYPEKGQPFFTGVFETLSKNPVLPYSERIIDLNTGVKLLNYKNKKAYLSRLLIGNRQVYVFAGPIESGAKGLSRHGLFVPVFYRLAFNSLKNLLPLSFSVNSEVVPWPIEKNTIPKKIEWVSGKKKITPGFRLLGAKVLADVPKSEVEPGIYEVIMDGVKSGFIAFNTNPDEGFMQFYSLEELKKMASTFPNITVERSIETSGDIQALVSDLGAEKLWPWLILAAMVFLLAEVLVLKLLKT